MKSMNNYKKLLKKVKCASDGWVLKSKEYLKTFHNLNISFYDSNGTTLYNIEKIIFKTTKLDTGGKLKNIIIEGEIIIGSSEEGNRLIESFSSMYEDLSDYLKERIEHALNEDCYCK